MITREELQEAVEVALGDTIKSEQGTPQSVSDRKVERQLQLLARTLRELDGHYSVEDILEALDA